MLRSLKCYAAPDEDSISEQRIELSKKLLTACWLGEVKAVSSLISEGADPNYGGQENGLTALHYASRQGYFEIVDCLVTEGHCDVNMRGTVM